MSEPTDSSAQPQRARERAPRYALQLPMRYRLTGDGYKEWDAGETVNLSKSGVLFHCEKLLEVGTVLEIIFQASGPPLLDASTRRARVVRRVLNDWPETRPLFGAKFL